MEHDAGSNAVDFDSAGFDQTLRIGTSPGEFDCVQHLRNAEISRGTVVDDDYV